MTSCKDVFKTSWRTKYGYAEDVFKTCLQEVLEKSKIFTGKEHISVSNKS